MEIISSILVFLYSLYLTILPTKELREGVVGQPISFYPMKNSSHIDKTITKLIYRGLFTYDIFGELTPDLIESWSISEDGKTYTFKLKDQQFWIDGSMITTDDVFYTAINTPSLQGIEINKIDNLEIKFTLQNKYAPFLHTMTTGIVKNNSLEKSSDLSPISSGKFRVVSVKKQGPLTKEVTLYSNQTQIPKLTFRFYNSPEELIWASKLMEIDSFILDQKLNEVDLERFTDHPFPLISNSYGLFFNLVNSPLSISKDDRVKISKSINVQGKFNEFGIPVDGVISRSSYTNKNLMFNKFDRKNNFQLSSNSLEIKVPDYKNNDEISQIIENELEDNLGIEVEIVKSNPEKFVEEIIQKKDFQAIFFGIENNRDPDRYLNWHSSGIGQGYNFTQFNNPVADQTLEQGRVESDQEKRRVHYNKFQDVFDQNQPAIFLFHPKVNYMVSKRVEGITQKYTFDLSDRFNDFSNWSIN